MGKITWMAGFFILFILACSGQVLAQELTPGQGSGAEAERYKDDAEKTRKALEYKKPKPPRIEIEQEKAHLVREGPSFVLKKVNVTGATVFDPQDFKPIYGPYIDKEVVFSDVEAVAEKIELEYKKKGYLTTIVYIPEQEILDGVIEIRVSEGRMGQLDVEGNKWFSTDFIRRFIHLKKNEILNIKTLERDILRLNKNPDLEIKAVIAPGKEPQTSDILLKLDDKFSWHTGFLEDNRGSRLTGRFRSMWIMRGSSVSGFGDTIFLNTLYSGRSFGEMVSYNMPVGTYGTRLGIDLTYFWLKLGKEVRSFDITGNTQIYTPYASWELALSEDYEAYANLGMDIKSVKRKTGDDTTSDEQFSIPFLSLDISKTGLSGQTSFSPRLSFGTSGFLGSSERGSSGLSRPDSGGSFFKYEQSLNRLQKMFLGSYITVRTRLQAATHTLAPSEQLQLGGADSVRGYPEGDYLADTGGIINLDWIFPMYIIPEQWKLPGQDIPLRFQVQPVFFADAGEGTLKKVLSEEEKEKFLAGAGGGLLVNFKNLSMRLYWAKDIADRPVSGAGPSTFYLSFQSEI